MANSTSIEDLTELRDDLYGGDWQTMLDDLVQRLAKRPYSYKLVTHLKADIPVIRGILRFHKNTLD